MKKTAIISFLALCLTACGNSAQVATNQTPNAQNKNNTETLASKTPDSMIAHSADRSEVAADSSAVVAAPSSKTQTESPMAKAVDVSELTAEIEKNLKQVKAKPTDANAKDTLAQAYFKRAFVLTDAAQYRAALGDFRKGLKLNPNEAEAKAMHDRIIGIFQSIKREPPKEGEEPPPMPIGK